MYWLLAHAGESHESSTEGLRHYLETWYYALPLWVLLLLIVGVAAYVLTHKSIPTTIGFVVFTMLFSGMFAYDLAPAVSILSIVLGLVICAFMTFAMLTGGNFGNTKK